MEKYVFRNELKCGSLEQLIRKKQEIHELMNIDDLCRKTGRIWRDICPALNAMIARGEAERLRPRDYENDDLDFFRLCGPPRKANIGTNHARWFGRFKRTARLIFDDPEDTSDYNHSANNILTMS